MNGADNIEAPVAAIKPTSPSSLVKYEIPKKNPNFGIRLKSYSDQSDFLPRERS